MLDEQDGIFALCETVQVKLSSHPGHGRVLVASSNLSAGDVVLSAPREHQVIWPTPSDEHTEVKTLNDERLFQDYTRVQEICDCTANTHGPHMYWAALMSLTAEERPPEHTHWPCISQRTQIRLLLLFQPDNLSSLCEGRQQVQTEVPPLLPASPSQRPKRVAKHVPTFDIISHRLCEYFLLRICPAKLERLLLVWKYNSFQSGFDGTCHGLDLYVAPAMASHSCSPNCDWQRGANGEFELCAGLKGLALGEQVTISYLDEETLNDKNTLLRRHILARNWLFICDCESCSFIRAPPCPCCSTAAVATPMDAVVSWAEEELYPGLQVFCDSCLTWDLQVVRGYFYHCELCATDFCPTCALKKLAESPRMLDAISDAIALLEAPAAETNHDELTNAQLVVTGQWCRPDARDSVEAIVGDTVCWSSGGSSRLISRSARCFSMNTDGTIYDAELLDNTNLLKWSDGEIWSRA